MIVLIFKTHTPPTRWLGTAGRQRSPAGFYFFLVHRRHHLRNQADKCITSFNVTVSLLIAAGFLLVRLRRRFLLSPVLACRAVRLGWRVRAFLVKGSARILGFSVGPYWLKPYFGNKRSNDSLCFEAPQKFARVTC